jgi:hypothetical protein
MNRAQNGEQAMAACSKQKESPKFQSAIELTEISGVEIHLGEGPSQRLERGRAILHAVPTDMLKAGEKLNKDSAICHTARRQLTPTYWDWHDDHPAHLERCAACLILEPASHRA